MTTTGVTTTNNGSATETTERVSENLERGGQVTYG